MKHLSRFLPIGLSILLSCKQPQDSAAQVLYVESQAQPAALQPEITDSRINAIVRAAQAVGPAVVSINVVQTRVVTRPFSPFGEPFFDEFFRDFFPQPQFRERVQALGSGVIVSPDGYIVTNAHVVESATEIKVVLPDARQFDAQVVGIDNALDIALLKIPGNDFPYAPLGNSDDLYVGEWAIALGNPFGFLLEDTQPSVTVGVISALHRSIRSGLNEDRIYQNMIQTDAAINPGNSGGPLVNAAGEVIGINTFIFTTSRGSEGVGFARSINDVKSFLDQIRHAGVKASSPRAAPVQGLKTKIGIRIVDRPGIGVVVESVDPHSLAAQLGIEEGDRILRVGTEKVNTAKDAERLIEEMGDRVELELKRRGSRLHIVYLG
jgi:serine protease Do